MDTEMYKTLLALAVSLISAGAAVGEELVPYMDQDAVAAGETLYAEHCAACHGAELEGEPNWQGLKENGMRPAPPHDETGHTWHHPDAQLFDLTKHGVAEVLARRGLDYQSDMMGFGDVLSDAEILAVLAYIKSTWPARVVEMHNKVNANQP